MMKKTYIRPELTCHSTAPATIIAASINISEGTTVTDADDVAVKDGGDWESLWD